MGQCAQISLTLLKGFWGHEYMDVTGWLCRQEAIGQCVQRTSHRLPLFDHHQVLRPLSGACRDFPPGSGTHGMYLARLQKVSIPLA